VKPIEGMILIDDSASMRPTRNNGVLDFMMKKLAPLMMSVTDDFGELSVPSTLEALEQANRVTPGATLTNCPKIIVCVTNGNCEDGMSRQLIEHTLTELPAHIFFVFQTVGIIDDPAHAWFESLAKREDHGKKFAVVRHYREESADALFREYVWPFMQRTTGR